MALVTLQKVAITWHKDVQSAVLDFLHKEGVLHITSMGNTTEEAIESPVLFTKADLEYCYNTLLPYADKNVKKNIAKQKNSSDKVEQTMKTFDFLGLIEELRQLEAIDTESIARIHELEILQERSALWAEYPYNLEQATSTTYTKTVVGTVPNAAAADFAQKVSSLASTVHELQVTDTVTCFVCTYLVEDEATFASIAQQSGFTVQQLPSGNGPVRNFIETTKLDIKDEQKKIALGKKRRTELSLELGKVIHAIKYVTWLNEKHDALKASVQTGSTVSIAGWMPKKDVNAFEAKLQRHFPATTLDRLSIEENEEPPVYLKNSTLLAPFESVTTLYGLPNNSEGDPTGPLSPFFILFFSLCLTDAGYGAALALIVGIYLWVKKLSIQEAKLPWLLFFSGLVTIVVSIPFGGWFGLAPNQVPEMFTKTTAAGELLFKGQIWNLGAQSGITFLQNLALVLGLVHLFYGMFLAGMHKWKHGRKAEAFWVDFTSHILMLAILFVALGPIEHKQISLYGLYTAIALLIWGKGYGNSVILRPIMGLLATANFSLGMVSNSLSYLRILALGLVTGAIALAVNQVAIEFSKFFPSFLQIPVIILICFAGHLVSIVLNVLGSFIHSGRLQFIEFFSQFFEGGGKEFTPFKQSL